MANYRKHNWLEPSPELKQKSFYHKAYTEETDSTEVLFSYNIPVLAVNGNGIFRLWGGYSKTSIIHIKAFLKKLYPNMNTTQVNKKWWEAMPVNELNDILIKKDDIKPVIENKPETPNKAEKQETIPIPKVSSYVKKAETEPVIDPVKVMKTGKVHVKGEKPVKVENPEPVKAPEPVKVEKEPEKTEKRESLIRAYREDENELKFVVGEKASRYKNFQRVRVDKRNRIIYNDLLEGKKMEIPENDSIDLAVFQVVPKIIAKLKADRRANR